MASTNKTTNLDLSQFVSTDRPDWLTDYNSDMEKIDAWAAMTESDISTVTADASSSSGKSSAFWIRRASKVISESVICSLAPPY